jgi:cell division protein FtsQ
MHQRKSKKILIYFFLLFLVGSVNNININNLKFLSVKDINVTGLENEDNSIISKKIKNLKLDNIYLINKKELNTLIETNNLVEKYFIFKKYPSTLNINIDKTVFLARISKNGKIYDLGSNGKLVENRNSNNQLPFVFGNPEIIEFFEIKKIIDGSEINFGDIKNLYFYLSQRWDLELKNNIIIKLPTDNVKDSLEKASKFLHHKDSKNAKIIDLRIKNQIIFK